VIDVHRIPLNGNDQPDRWLMQSVVKHSSSDAARAVAAVWLGAYDTALSFGSAASRAQLLADVAYRPSAALAGLPIGDGRQA
jgi:hypothetical protein